ncbi:hypothetical protein [uncultured Dechloromonas sp.]|uniref:glycine-rich domain-containing protein n=1 Tax=uncultured Dechloromonas sp. TaxID=171719 RepID=UPI0025EC6070|nr:hypothetical protein [uncultured Dechloromonas sp.]
MAKIIVIAILLLLATVLWRNWSRQRRAGYIDAFPYRRMLDQRLAARRPELTETQRGEVFAALVDYFAICNTAGRRMVAMPSQAVDDAWHEFILFTRQYDKYCRRAFGRFLHHTPAEAMASPTQASQGLRRAWRLACRREGIDPQKPDRLPRLFALDARLGIAGGFVYRLDCLAAQQGGDASGYCASHLGCGGSSGSDGCSGDSGSGCGGGCGGGD